MCAAGRWLAGRYENHATTTGGLWSEEQRYTAGRRAGRRFTRSSALHEVSRSAAVAAHLNWWGGSGVRTLKNGR